MLSEWQAALDAFTAYALASERKRATTKQYCQHLWWLAETAPAGPAEMSGAQLRAWLDQRNWSQATRKNVMVSIRAFYAWAVRTGRVEWSPTAGLGVSARIKRRGPAPQPLNPLWVEPVESFETWCRSAGRSAQTISTRRSHLRHFSQQVADPWAVTSDQLTAYLANADWRPETRRSNRASLRVFYRWAEETGRIPRSPAEKLPSVLTPHTLPRPVPDDVIAQALWAADDRTRLAIMLAAYAGLRRTEIARLHTSEIAADHLMIVGKGGKHRRVPLHPDLAEALRVEVGRRERGEHGTGWRGRFVSVPGYLFPSDHYPEPMTAAHLGGLISDALPGTWTAHTLRHRFATRAYAAQRDLRAVQELLGHTKPETTARYAAVPDGALTAAVAGVGITYGPGHGDGGAR